MVWGAWLLFACRAEDLKIQIPPQGLASLSQEDLERDVWQLGKEKPDKEWYRHRMNQMGLKSFSVPKGVCFGENEWKRLVVVEQEHPSYPLSRAVQISLAKVQHAQAQKISFCIYKDSLPIDGWVLGDMRGMILHVHDKKIKTKLPNKDIHYPRLIEHMHQIIDILSLR